MSTKPDPILDATNKLTAVFNEILTVLESKHPPHPPTPSPPPSPPPTPTPSPSPPPPSPSPTSTTLDIDGVQKFFEDTTTVKSWRLGTQDANNATDFEIEQVGTATKHVEAGVTYWNTVGKDVSYASGAPSGKTTRLNIFAPGAKGKTQTHTWKDNPTELYPGGYHNFELTDYIRVHSNTGTHTESSHKLRGGIHTGSNDPRASTIEMTHELKGKSPRRAKEFNHPNYDYQPVTAGPAASDGGIVENRWIGRKVISSMNADGSVNNTFYIDTDAFDATGKPVNHWRLYSTWKDTQGQSSMYPPVCNWSGFITTCRTDGWFNIDFASIISIREIDPTKPITPGQPPIPIPPPPTPAPIPPPPAPIPIPSPSPPPPTPIPIPPPSPPPIPPSPPAPPVMGTIDVTNFSSAAANTDIQKWVDAIKIQCDHDVAPIWGHTVNFNAVSSGNIPVAGNWQCGFFDDSTQAGVLGWHDVGPNNEPLIKIFVKEAMKFGENPSVTLSHEVIECIGDANANTTVKGQDPSGKPCLLFQELCDAVESSLYDINGVKVSDFLFPNWFNELPKTNEMDFLKVVPKQFQLAAGGYEEVSYDNGATWSQINKASQRLGMHAISHRKTIYHKRPEDRIKSTFEMQSV